MSKHTTTLLALTFVYLSASVVTQEALAEDWPIWGKDASRNMVAPDAGPIPHDFYPGDEIGRTGKIDPDTQKKIKWVAKLGSQAFGNPVVSQGKILVGTNNESPRNEKYKGDRSVFYCLDEKTGDLLWEFSLHKLGAGKVSDWEFLGMCSSPAVYGDRVYVVTNLCEIVCLDLNGMANGNQGLQDEGAYFAGKGKPPIAIDDRDADVIWRYDMREELNVFPHNITSNSCLVIDDIVYVATSNGVDWSHINVPTPNAPSLIALDAKTGELVGEDGSGIGPNIMHCNWSSPSFGTFDGKPTVIFGAGDGFLYGFRPQGHRRGRRRGLPHPPRPCGRWTATSRRTALMTTAKPIPYATPPGPSEYHRHPCDLRGAGLRTRSAKTPSTARASARLSCIDPTQVDEDGNAKIVWQFTDIGRSISTCSSRSRWAWSMSRTTPGKVYCLDAQDRRGEVVTTTPYGHIWSVDARGTNGKVFLGNEDGILTILEAGPEKKLLAEVEFPAPIYSSAIAANGVLYVATQSHLYAISADAQ